MSVKNCPQCGRIFMYTTRNLCPRCIEEDEENYLKVKEYLWENPGANIAVVSEETGVSEKKIISYLREGRLELSKNSSGIVLYCERCDAKIFTGRFCDKCAKDLKSGLSQGLGGGDASDENKWQGKDPNLSKKDKMEIHMKDRFRRR
ncbi:flagellar operon protein (TIGR03826 family) [Desulfitispora alkaliphila]|uniref:TIGR03826 family flagellar region protein n=1 Tax=Desulfitispora alkaliphila TaxID=622674 RepID=UPI003D1A1FE2